MNDYTNTFYLHKKYPSIRIEMTLNECNSFEEFEALVEDQFLADDTRVGDFLDRLVRDKGMDYANISTTAGLHRSYVGNIINGKKNNPSRDALIAIGLAVRAKLEDIQNLLKYAGHAPLYVRRKRDVIIWFGIQKKKTISEIDSDLHERGYKTFFKY